MYYYCNGLSKTIYWKFKLGVKRLSREKQSENWKSRQRLTLVSYECFQNTHIYLLLECDFEIGGLKSQKFFSLQHLHKFLGFLWCMLSLQTVFRFSRGEAWKKDRKKLFVLRSALMVSLTRKKPSSYSREKICTLTTHIAM